MTTDQGTDREARQYNAYLLWADTLLREAQAREGAFYPTAFGMMRGALEAIANDEFIDDGLRRMRAIVETVARVTADAPCVTPTS